MREFFTAKDGETHYCRDGGKVLLLGNPPEPQSHAKAVEVRRECTRMARLADRPLSSWPKAYARKKWPRYRAMPAGRS